MVVFALPSRPKRKEVEMTLPWAGSLVIPSNRPSGHCVRMSTSSRARDSELSGPIASLQRSWALGRATLPWTDIPELRKRESYAYQEQKGG